MHLDLVNFSRIDYHAQVSSRTTRSFSPSQPSLLVDSDFACRSSTPRCISVFAECSEDSQETFPYAWKIDEPDSQIPELEVFFLVPATSSTPVSYMFLKLPQREIAPALIVNDSDTGSRMWQELLLYGCHLNNLTSLVKPKGGPSWH